jgi:hypothetical protein
VGFLDRVVASRRRAQLRRLVKTVRDFVDSNGIPSQDVPALLHEYHAQRRLFRPDFDDAASAIFKENRVPTSQRAFRLVVETLGEILEGLPPTNVLRPLAVVIAEGLRQFLAVLLFGFVSYMVLGGIASGHTIGTPRPPVFALGIFAVLMVVLAVVEGLHLSVGRLGLKDLSSLQNRYPRAYRLHKLFRTASGTTRFLAGRQLVVIMVVFVAARFTSFMNMQTWPLTSISLPPSLRSGWFEEVFFRLGLLGALFVLWFGQLIPQLFATKRPVGFLNLVGMNLAMRCCFLLEAIGLAKPGNWPDRWIPEEGYIPASAADRYKVEVENVQGFGFVGLSVNCLIERDGATLDLQNTTRFARPDFNRIIDGTLLLRKTGTGKITRELKPNRLSPILRHIVAQQLWETELDLPSGSWRRLNQEVAPSIGRFLPGDVLVTNASFSFDGGVTAHQLSITNPTLYVLFRVTFADEPHIIPEPHVRGVRIDESLVDRVPFLDAQIPIQKDELGRYFAEFVALYPDLNTSYEFAWNVDYC